MRIRGMEATWETPTRSRVGSNDKFALILSMIDRPFEVSRIVCPSGRAFATLAIPTIPDRFSMMTGCCQSWLNLSTMARPIRSVVLPGEGHNQSHQLAWIGNAVGLCIDL